MQLHLKLVLALGPVGGSVGEEIGTALGEMVGEAIGAEAGKHLVSETEIPPQDSPNPIPKKQKTAPKSSAPKTTRERLPRKPRPKD
jgi:phage tail tape-measure protein